MPKYDATKGVFFERELIQELGAKKAFALASFILNIPQFDSYRTEYNMRALLKREKLLEKQDYSEEELKHILSTKNYIDFKRCEWCKEKTIILHEHHYPVQKKDGGTKTVKICPNCHAGYHYLKTRKKLVPTKRVAKYFENE